jgi:vacuolar-type H+-ATPase subunit H
MDINKVDMRRISEPSFGTAANGLDPDEVYSFIIALIDQNAELVGKLENLDSLKKLSENIIIEARRQAECIASEIEKEANNRASAIISEAENRAKVEADRIKAKEERKIEDARQERINTAIQEGQVITQKAIEKAEIIEARAKEEVKKIIDEAEKKAEYSRKEVRKLAEKETQNTLKEKNGKAPREALPIKQRPEKRESNSEVRWRVKGMVRYYWNMEIERQQHSIEIFLNTVLGIFATGGGQLLVDGGTVLNWGGNPFTLIPKGRIDFEVIGRRAFIKSKGTTSNHPVLVLGNQEIPPIISKI